MVETKIEKQNLKSTESEPVLSKDVIAKLFKEQEPLWLTKFREKALEAYNKTSLPDRVSHLWKYSDPSLFDVSTDSKFLTTKDFLFSSNLLPEEGKQKGIIINEFCRVLSDSDSSKIIQNKLGQIVDNYPNRIKYLNDVFFSGGFFLYVPAGIKINEPIITKISSSGSNKFGALRGLIVLDKNASVSFIDEIVSVGSNDLHTNVVLEIFLESGAKLNYLNLQSHDREVTHHIFQRAWVNENAELNNLIVSLGGKNVKADLGAELIGQGACVNTYGIVLGDGEQRFDHHTTISHNKPFTKSSLDFRVALKDKARSAYTGNLKILHEAVKSDAHQENRNLLLSDKAKAESIPELEILTNDVVRCNHGVTVGQVDKEQIYYLMSRGVDEKTAEKIIIQGFLEPTISRIPDEKLKEEVLNKINNKLENL